MEEVEEEDSETEEEEVNLETVEEEEDSETEEGMIGGEEDSETGEGVVGAEVEEVSTGLMIGVTTGMGEGVIATASSRAVTRRTTTITRGHRVDSSLLFLSELLH